jgi:Ca-activated chloride channel family protein
MKRLAAVHLLLATLTSACGMKDAAPNTESRVAGYRGEAKSEERRMDDRAAAAPHGGIVEEIRAPQENQFVASADDAKSTFSIDVDTASYSNIRRMLTEGTLPLADAVRIEEMVNYFDYDYEPPTGDAPFSMQAEVGPCPWAPDHRLVHIGLQGAVIDEAKVPPRNLVFLLDVSGSMNSPDRLPLLARGLGTIVVYAGASGVVLEPTSDKAEIMAALSRLEAGGSTNGGAGIELAYALAERNFDKDGINRVILATDGDFNVGVTSNDALVELIESKRQTGVFLSVLGFGSGNMKDSTMEMLADKGNGNYAYIDSIAEARKVLVEQAGSTLVTIAKDVKVQVAFDEKKVASWRLVGYENRVLAHADFTNDTKDAGEIGAGHSVTAMYEIVPTKDASEGRIMDVALRYKDPTSETSKPLDFVVEDRGGTLAERSDDSRFAAAVAEAGMLLRKSEHTGLATWASAIELAKGALGKDAWGRRAEFVTLVEKARDLAAAKG